MGARTAPQLRLRGALSHWILNEVCRLVLRRPAPTDMAPEGSIIRATSRALLAPRRLGLILLTCAPLVVAQAWYSEDPLAVPLGIAMCLVVVLVAPVSFRVLFPEGFDLSHGAIRVLMYGTIGVG